MIPKIIHYCWFGKNPKPKLSQKCIDSWKKYCPDYEIIEWNEDNFDIESAPMYVQEAYQAKKWAFVTDYVRLLVVYNQGGIYLDTDVEVVRSLDSLLCYDAFFGRESEKLIATGLGFGAVSKHPILLDLMADYKDRHFILPNGEYDTLPCTDINTDVFVRYGAELKNTLQIIDKGIYVFPTEYFSPKNYFSGKINKTENTYSIHHFSASWYTEEAQKQHKREMRKVRLYIAKVNFKNAVFKLLGDKLYSKIKSILKK